MTVSSENAKSGPYACNGVTVNFPYAFRILDETHVKVILTNAAGVETVLTLNTDYTVTGVGAANGGNIVVSPARASGNFITNLRNPPFTQETDLQNQGAYYAETVEDRFDLLTMQIQAVKERADRSVALPASDEDDPDVLVADIKRAGAFPIVVVLTQSEYDALSPPSSTTLYLVVA